MYVVALIAVICALWLLYRKKWFSFFKDLNIPGPEPNLLFGNIVEIIRRNPIQSHAGWLKKYGKVVGYFYGTKPVILIADADLLKKIQVSDFNSFINRPDMFSSRSRSTKRVEGFSQHIISLRDKRWKDVRSLLTPSFTASKMRQMSPLMNDAIQSLMINIDKKCKADEHFDIYKLYQGLTMDVVGRTAFGIQTDVQNNPKDPFLRAAKALFSGDIRNPLIILAVSFRSLSSLWIRLGRLRLIFVNQGTNPITELIGNVKEVIATRRKNQQKARPDLLQLMLDAEGTDGDSVTADDLTASDEKEVEVKGNKGKISKKLSDADVLDNSVLFFLAAYETTSTALAFTTHLLIKHPDVQEKVRKEVLQLLKSEGELDYNSVNMLQYLDQVLKESLRLYPPVHLFVNREVSENCEINGIQFKKGAAIQVAVYHLHRDPDYWENPTEFRPERFSPENKDKINPIAYQPFGAGPRNCIGMRFALMEAKLALAQILSKYSLKRCSKTEDNVTLKMGQFQINPKYGIWTKAVSF
ncbi:cytochrome P450 3A24 isoform X2 [Parasteatoda tepidariorum]|uniref:cytochrome P450 3A24 isoform X2 n=2 Tax=Parasteatoda tepidariorum TaxID=114398 RepID=UPI00077FBB92|nr:cytochrome P450 3A24 isoform X2 [Parasteatoda tepidariorum]